MKKRKLIPLEGIELFGPLDVLECSPFGQIVNRQYKPYLDRINDLKNKTDWKEGEDILPFIPNYVMNMTFETDIYYRLTDLPLHLPNTYYNKEEFAAPTVRILKTACLVFDNGKLVITGGQSDNNVIYGAYQYRRQLMQVVHLVKVLNDDGTPMMASEDELIQPTPPCPIPPNTRPNVKKPVYAMTTMEKLMRFKHFNLVNVVGTGIASSKPIDLSLLSKVMAVSSNAWIPEVFPGLKFKIRNTHCPIGGPKCTCHIFDSGAVVIMGATCDEDVTNGFIFLKCIVKCFIDHRIGKTKVVSKFQYRINLIEETNDLFENMPSEETTGLEKKILDEASIKCFGSYLYDREIREKAKNLAFSGDIMGLPPLDLNGGNKEDNAPMVHRITQLRQSQSLRVRIPTKKTKTTSENMSKVVHYKRPREQNTQHTPTDEPPLKKPKTLVIDQNTKAKMDLFFGSLQSS